MAILRRITLVCLLILSFLSLAGCGKKADENKPVSEIKAEAEKMSEKKLRAMAKAYKDAIEARQRQVGKLAAKFKETPFAELLGGEATKLKADIESLNKSLSALTERFQLYYQNLKEKGADLSGLEI